MPRAGEGHGEAEAIGGSDDGPVLLRTAGLDDGGYPRLGGLLDALGQLDEPVAGHDGPPRPIARFAQGQHGGAGITAGQIVGNQQVDAVIVENMGPKAFSVMQSLNIKCYRGVRGTVRENVGKFLSGELEAFGSPPAFGRRHMI